MNRKNVQVREKYLLFVLVRVVRGKNSSFFFV